MIEQERQKINLVAFKYIWSSNENTWSNSLTVLLWPILENYGILPHIYRRAKHLPQNHCRSFLPFLLSLPLPFLAYINILYIMLLYNSWAHVFAMMLIFMVLVHTATTPLQHQSCNDPPIMFPSHFQFIYSLQTMLYNEANLSYHWE